MINFSQDQEKERIRQIVLILYRDFPGVYNQILEYLDNINYQAGN